MKILGIETSCDDTGIAILATRGEPTSWKILSNIVSSQVKVHQKYGGVYPMMAKREHQKNLVPVLKLALLKAGKLIRKTKNQNQKEGSKFKTLKNILNREEELFKKIFRFFQNYKKPDIDVIAVTNGPGLEPCLWVGVNFARALSFFWNIPIVAVNHLEAHILINLLKNPDIKVPAIALLASGGHTQIVLVKKIGKYKILGETRDDAAGECFDKCAKILGLGYPGGPIISKLAKKSQTQKFNHLPRPMINTKDYDFSFSGLKTAVLYADKKIKRKNKKYQKEMAAEIEQAIIDVLLKKTIRAAKDFRARSLILGGGVTANNELRRQFLEKFDVGKIFFPEPQLATDNALMVAAAGYFKAKHNKFIKWQKLEANANLGLK